MNASPQKKSGILQRTGVLAYGKEAGLLFLSLFYFVIATNTQTGWLFVLSAFLLGLLFLSWILSRQAIKGLQVEQNFHTDPQRSKPFRIETTLRNTSRTRVQEVHLGLHVPNWASSKKTRAWLVPNLSGGESASTEFEFIPILRGEHQLGPVRLVCGAPFGLFPTSLTYQCEQRFLVHPTIEALPHQKSGGKIATTIGELVSPRGLGDTRNLRSLRDYHPGDDLRQVHWKASAKTGGNARLLVKEFHAPAPSKTIIILDNSASGSQAIHAQLFERAVTLAASILWAAHREGTSTVLCHMNSDGHWQTWTIWSQQYLALAKIQVNPDLDFLEWSSASDDFVNRAWARKRNANKPILIKACLPQKAIATWPKWMKTALLLEAPQNAKEHSYHPGLNRLNGLHPGFHPLGTQEENDV